MSTKGMDRDNGRCDTVTNLLVGRYEMRSGSNAWPWSIFQRLESIFMTDTLLAPTNGYTYIIGDWEIVLRIFGREPEVGQALQQYVLLSIFFWTGHRWKAQVAFQRTGSRVVREAATSCCGVCSRKHDTVADPRAVPTDNRMENGGQVHLSSIPPRWRNWIFGCHLHDKRMRSCADWRTMTVPHVQSMVQ